MNRFPLSIATIHTNARRIGVSRTPVTRLFSAKDDANTGTTTGPEWRKKELDRLEAKFSNDVPPPLTIEDEGSLQPTWKAMEARVKNRRPLTREQRGGKAGRVNIKRTDEEIWLAAGLYDEKK
jgi:hypothetical protein